MRAARGDGAGHSATEAPASGYSEKTPLLSQQPAGPFEEVKPRRRWLYPKRISQGIVGAVGFLLTPIVYTGRYVVACFYYEENGQFSLLAPIYHLARPFSRSRRRNHPSRPSMLRRTSARAGIRNLHSPR
jgi:CTD nuclear envelope phosphatase 1